ncbi:MAG: LuxR C-terminal-related transcriptional regulator [Microbacterium enclense]
MAIAGIPRLPPRFSERSRLTERLDAPTALVVLFAPSGYGKTSALASWGARTTRVGVWVRAGDGTRDMVPFVSAVARALLDAGVVPADDPLRDSLEATSPRHPFDSLTRALRRVAPITLVVDEAEHLGEDVIAELVELVQHVPTVSLRVATRRRDGFTEAALGAIVERDLVALADLRLSPAEVSSITGEQPGTPLHDEILRAGGSAAVANLAASGDDVVLDGAILESLIRLRERAWGDEFTRFLEVASLSEIIDTDLVGRLCPESDPQHLIDRAETEGMGHREGSVQSSTFVIASVFREVFSRRAGTRLTAAQLRSTHRTISLWHLSTGGALPAFHHAVLSSDPAVLTSVVRQTWGLLLRSADEVRALSPAVPFAALTASPLTSMLFAILWNAKGAHRLRALQYFALAIGGGRLHQKTATPSDRALLGAVESAALRISGRPDAAFTVARQTARLLGELEPTGFVDLGRNVSAVYNHVGMSLMYGSRPHAATESFLRSEAIGEERGLTAGLEGRSNAAGAFALQGDLAAASDAIARAEHSRWPDGWRDGYAGSLLHLAEAVIALEAGDDALVLRHLEPLAPHRATIEHAGLLQYIETIAHLGGGDVNTATVSMARMRARQRGQRRLAGLGEAMTLDARILIELAAGRLVEAERLLSRLPDTVAGRLSRARVRLAQGNVDSALTILAVSVPEEPEHRLRAEHSALTLAALALLDADEPDTPHDLAAPLERLSAALEVNGLTVPLLLVPVGALDEIARLPLSPTLAAAMDTVRSRAFIPSAPRQAALSARERQVALALTSGKTLTEIAVELSVSRNTVKTQLRSIYRKLGVHDRKEAVLALARRGSI